MPHHHKKAGPSPASLAFVLQVSQPARTSETRTGVPASITIAQAILESGWGRHHIGSANNYFGVKAQTRHGKVTYGSVATGYVMAPTTEEVHGKKIHITAPFRSYTDINDSFTDHGLFLRNNPRYAHGFQVYAATGDADAFAQHLQQAGYATEHDYAQTLISLMHQYNLYQYNLRTQP